MCVCVCVMYNLFFSPIYITTIKNYYFYIQIQCETAIKFKYQQNAPLSCFRRTVCVISNSQ